MTTRFEHLLNI